MVGVTGFIPRAADMSPVRTLGGSKWDPTAGQVMCTGCINFIEIMRGGAFNLARNIRWRI